MKEEGESAYLRYKRSLRTDGATPNILSFLGGGEESGGAGMVGPWREIEG
jgi:hypothetical protein